LSENRKLRLRVDGQRQAIRALEGVIGGLRLQLRDVRCGGELPGRKGDAKGVRGQGERDSNHEEYGRVVSPDGGRKSSRHRPTEEGEHGALSKSLRDFPPPAPPPSTRHRDHETARALRSDLSSALKQNRALQTEVKRLKGRLREAREKEERSREITGELKRYSNKLRDELEELREDLINKGSELDRARKERKKATQKVTAKKEKFASEARARRLAADLSAPGPIKQSDVDAVAAEVRSMKDEREKDKATIARLNREADGLRHRLARAKANAKK